MNPENTAPQIISVAAIVDTAMLDRLCQENRKRPAAYPILKAKDGSESALIDTSRLAELLAAEAELNRMRAEAEKDRCCYIQIDPTVVFNHSAHPGMTSEDIAAALADLFEKYRHYIHA